MTVRASFVWQGETAAIELTVYDRADAISDADEVPTVTIRRKDNPIAVVDGDEMSADPIRGPIGCYVYLWDTTEVPGGEYDVMLRWVIDGYPSVEHQTLPVKAE